MARIINLKQISLIAVLLVSLVAKAQVGDHRNDFAIGGGAGVVLNKVGFVPNVPQNMHLGTTFGVTARYIRTYSEDI